MTVPPMTVPDATLRPVGNRQPSGQTGSQSKRKLPTRSGPSAKAAKNARLTKQGKKGRKGPPSRPNDRATERPNDRPGDRPVSGPTARSAGKQAGKQRSMSRELKGALHPRGWLLKVGLPIVSMIAVGIAVVVIVHANSGKGASPEPANAASVGYPPADLAASDFTGTPADAGRGLVTMLGSVASSGNELVAIGAQKGGRIGRALFYYSTNGGSSWQLGSQQAHLVAKNKNVTQTTPPPDHAPDLVTNGRHGWVAIGPDSIWTSPDGKTWTMTSSRGLPRAKSDGSPTILVSTNNEYLAASHSGTIWVSRNGGAWWKLKGTSGLNGVEYGAANGRTILLATPSEAWTSSFGGHWFQAKAPTTGGASNSIVGVTQIGTKLAVIRPGKISSQAYVYITANGAGWTRAGSFGTSDGQPLTVTSASGGPSGAVVTGVAHNYLIAFITSNGATWTGTDPLGTAKSQEVRSATMAGSGTAIAVGWSQIPHGTQALLSVVGTKGSAKSITLPLPVSHQIATNAIATSGATEVVVGSADGYPAIWFSTDGGSSWKRATGSALNISQVRKMEAVAHGPAGWVAVGGLPSPGGAAARSATAVVVTSTDGSTWTSAGSTFGATGMTASGVAAGPSGYVIVGQQGASAVAWFSPDLKTWHSVSLPSAAGSDAYSVTSAGHGFVIIGTNGPHPQAWISHNGTAWSLSAIPLPKGALGARMHWVAANGNTILAVGGGYTATGAGTPFVAESTNGGTSWKDTPLPVSPSWSWVFDTAITAAGSGFVVTGVEGTGLGDMSVVIWTLRNGTWTETTPSGRGMQGQGVQAITALTQAGNTLTGVGVIATPTSEVPTFWQSPVRS
jgi:hypothetical protein